MFDFDAMATFVEVVQLGSFSAAAKALRLPRSTAGVGIAPVPSILCAEDVRKGRLVRVLADWSINRKDLRVVYPSKRHLSPRVRLFVDMLVAELRKREAATAELPASDERGARARRATKRGAR